MKEIKRLKKKEISQGKETPVTCLFQALDLQEEKQKKQDLNVIHMYPNVPISRLAK